MSCLLPAADQASYHRQSSSNNTHLLPLSPGGQKSQMGLLGWNRGRVRGTPLLEAQGERLLTLPASAGCLLSSAHSCTSPLCCALPDSLCLSVITLGPLDRPGCPQGPYLEHICRSFSPCKVTHSQALGLGHTHARAGTLPAELASRVPHQLAARLPLCLCLLLSPHCTLSSGQTGPVMGWGMQAGVV